MEFIESVASVVVQTAARQFLARRRVEKIRRERNRTPLSLFDVAAIHIQAAFRGWWVRDCNTVDNYCACIIQKNFRMYQCRSNYEFDLYCVMVLQALFRGYLVRKRLGTSRQRSVHRAATVIQSKWRGFVCEIKFLQAYEDIIVVQSVARGSLGSCFVRGYEHTISKYLVCCWANPNRSNVPLRTTIFPRTMAIICNSWGRILL